MQAIQLASPNNDETAYPLCAPGLYLVMYIVNIFNEFKKRVSVNVPVNLRGLYNFNVTRHEHAANYQTRKAVEQPL
jgi:hypothetical protein